jgi:hypothetical protein
LITNISTTTTSPTPKQLPKLQYSISTQTKTIETKSIGIEVESLDNNEYLNQQQQHQNIDYCTSSTTVVTSDVSSNNNNKRKYEFKSPIKTDSRIDKTDTIKTNVENIPCFNQTDNSTPKKRRLIIGKNVPKVPSLSISTIERHLEMLTSNSVNNQAANDFDNNDSDVLNVEQVNLNAIDNSMVGTTVFR